MKSPTLASLVALCLLAPIAAAQHVVQQVTFPPGCGCGPELAVSLDHYTAVAYITEQPGDPNPQVAVQLVPTNPDTDEAWPDPVYFGAGSRPAICWSRDGFTLAFSGPDGVTVRVYQTGLDDVWDLQDPEIFQPGGEIMGLDLWGAPTDAAGHAVFLVVDDDPDPGNYYDQRVHFASRSSYTGWTSLEPVLEDLQMSNGTQVTWEIGPAGPWPQICFLDGTPEGVELFRISRGEAGWSEPIRVPGDGASGPTSFEWEIDVARSMRLGIVGLGPQPTCPCGTTHFVTQDWNGGWLPEEDLTVLHDHFNWPFSPRIDIGWDNVEHVFWYQRTSSEFLQPLGGALEYWTFDDGSWTDRGGFLDAFDRGIGLHVDVGVTPDGERSVLAWSLTDTIDGEPQLEQVFLARSTTLLAAPPEDLPHPGVALAAWPNPFNPRVNLAVTLPAAGALRLDVYDARGRHVRQVHHGALSAGRHEFAWDGTLEGGRKAPTGVYFAQAVTGAGNVARKLVLAE